MRIPGFGICLAVLGGVVLIPIAGILFRPLEVYRTLGRYGQMLIDLELNAQDRSTSRRSCFASLIDP